MALVPNDPFFRPELFDFLRQINRHRLGDRWQVTVLLNS